MLLPAIKTLITDLNQTNVKLSQYQNFQLWIISLNSEDSDYEIVNTIDIILDYQDTLTCCYESLSLVKQQTIAKEVFWTKLMKQYQALYHLEPSSNIYLLTKKGINFFKNNTIEEKLNYYNYNILTILISLQKINNFSILEPEKDTGQNNFIE